MASRYTCQDCSYQGHKFKQGRCPACGSAKISSGNNSEQEAKRGPLGLIICIGLWGVLGFVLVRRFLF